MKYYTIKGLEKPVFRLVLGADIHIKLCCTTIMEEIKFLKGG
jgi:hypothetical protein